MNRIHSQLKNAAPLFAALGDPVRLGIVDRLSSEGPLTTIDLKRGTTVTRQAVTRHLRILEDNGIVQSQRSGRDRLWQIEAQQLSVVRSYLDQISRQWDAALDRLKRFVEDEPGQ